MSKSIVKEKLERDFTIVRSEVNEDSRTVEIAFSSEEPYMRWFGEEVLNHDPQSVKLDRLNNGGAVLVNHDTDDQVGVVESARVDGDRRGRAVIRFSKSDRGQEIYQDVIDGIRSLVSVGYKIHKYDVTERDGQADLVEVKSWEPYEVSIVSIPADPSVGVGRSDEASEVASTSEVEKPKQEINPEKVEKNMSDTLETKSEEIAPAVDREKELGRLRTEEARRRDSIQSVADKYDLPELAREAISEGWDASEFNKKALEKVGERNSKAKADSEHNGDVDLSRKDKERFSLTRLMHAIANPQDKRAQDAAQHEYEVGQAASRGFGDDFKERGAFVPPSVLDGQRDLSVGTATAGGNLVATNLLEESYIDVLRNSSALIGAGAMLLPGLVGNVAIPRQTSGATSTWISAEDGDAGESDPAFDQVALTPKDLACYTEVTRRLFQQSTPAIEGLVRRDLAVAQALGIDLAGLYGSGASGQPTGIANQTGINTFNFAAADPTYAEIVRMIKEVMSDNALLGNLQFIIEANGWEALSTTPKQGSGVEGNFILGENDRIKGYPYTVSNQLTDEDYFFGNFSDMIIGEWGGLEIDVDPYTHSLKGKVRYITFKTCDVAVRHPESFIHCNDGV